ncbi:MAG: deoxyuridine 5'-triphosphate nucleotidohydrolase [delta proteobacterium ML8_F1]|nr:MAG: deoxyuridine 5'-triphosphate nucleotidohydrolase [delta proteobacterium ML8_F1]
MSKVKIVNKGVNPLPEYKTPGSSGMDLMAWLEEPLTLESLERALVPTGLYIELQPGYEAQIRPRSGMSIKHGLTLINAVGTIDSDYRGELRIPVVNLSREPFTIHSGDRIAQMIVAPYDRVILQEVDSLEDSDRGEGGFGSTGR